MPPAQKTIAKQRKTERHCSSHRGVWERKRVGLHPIDRIDAGEDMISHPQDETSADYAALSDAALAQRVAGNDETALCLLMRRYNQTLYRTVRSILKDDAEAEDAVQEVYLRACHAMHGFRGEAKLSTWLVRIAINEALGRVRKSRRRAEVIVLAGGSAQEVVDMGVENVMEPYASSPERPETATFRAQVRHMIEDKVDQLPEVYRTVFVLRAIEEMSVEETAECLSIPAATVRSRFFRARGLLRESLAREIDLSMETAFGFAGERCDRIVAGVLAKLHKARADACSHNQQETQGE